jgi:hypothetical protein
VRLGQTPVASSKRTLLNTASTRTHTHAHTHTHTHTHTRWHSAAARARHHPHHTAATTTTTTAAAATAAANRSEDGSALFYLQDRDGDENSHLFMVPLSAIMRGGGGGSSGSGSSSSGGSSASSRAGGSSTDSSDAHSSGAHSSASSSRPAAIDLTPWPGVKVQGIITNERFPNRVYFTMNRRDARVFDLYQLDVDSRAVQLHAVNPGDVGQWITDYDFDIRVSVMERRRCDTTVQRPEAGMVRLRRTAAAGHAHVPVCVRGVPQALFRARSMQQHLTRLCARGCRRVSRACCRLWMRTTPGTAPPTC